MLDYLGENNMNWKILILFLAVLVFSANVGAQQEDGQPFGQNDTSWKRADEKEQPKPLPQFEKMSGKTAMKNIFEAEQIFCYEVFPNSAGHEGYTLNGFPIRGFCGVLNKDTAKVITPFFFSNQAAVNFDSMEKCSISPKIMMRFVRGVDFTDVLFSSPCNALAIFYAGKVNVYNFTPLTTEMNEIIKQFESLHESFVSPALLNQLLPMGVVQNEQQRNLVNKTNEPVRKWEKQANEQMKNREAEIQKQNTGWNKLKNNMN